MVATTTRIPGCRLGMWVVECKLCRVSCSSFIAAMKGRTVEGDCGMVVVRKKGVKPRWKEWACGDKLFCSIVRTDL
jgi:hypothetical protein